MNKPRHPINCRKAQNHHIINQRCCTCGSQTMRRKNDQSRKKRQKPTENQQANITKTKQNKQTKTANVAKYDDVPIIPVLKKLKTDPVTVWNQPGYNMRFYLKTQPKSSVLLKVC